MTWPVHDTVHVYTLYKVQEKTRPCLTGNPVTDFRWSATNSFSDMIFYWGEGAHNTCSTETEKKGQINASSGTILEVFLNVAKELGEGHVKCSCGTLESVPDS